MKKTFTKDVEIALKKIQSHIRKTPLQYSPILSKQTGTETYIKLENFQITGSFKARGATNNS